MLGETLLLSEPEFVLKGPGQAVLRVQAPGGFTWRQLSEGKLPARLRELFQEALGAPIQLEFERVGAPTAAAGKGGVRSVYEEPIVVLAQRELDARAMG